MPEFLERETVTAAIDNAIPRLRRFSGTRYRRQFSVDAATAFFLRVLSDLPEGATILDIREALGADES